MSDGGPIARMIDAVVVCTICGKPPGCRCWVVIRCTACGRQRSTERTEEFFDFDHVDIVCPDCSPSTAAAEGG